MKIFHTVRMSSARLPSNGQQICANVPGTWAHDTMTRRIPKDMLPRIAADNAAVLERSPVCAERWKELLNSLQPREEQDSSQVTSPLRELLDCGDDVGAWRELTGNIAIECSNWLDAPWIVTEFYLHRRVVEAFQFFETGYDPYKIQKQNGLYACMDAVDQLGALFLSFGSGQESLDLIELGVMTSLWGNKKDLSLFPAAPPSPPIASSGKCHDMNSSDISTASHLSIQDTVAELRQNSSEYILDNQINKLLSYFHILIDENVTTDGSNEKRIGIVVDNAGFEIISDFFLGYALLEAGAAARITFYTKAHPTFVSDATSDDCHEIINHLASNGRRSASRIANVWKRYVAEGKFIFESDFFWCQPTGFQFRPDPIAESLRRNSMNFIKGDANYRRLLDDRQWPEHTPSDDLLAYWGADTPVCALRALKSEVICGVTVEKQKHANDRDKSWRVSGDWAVIQCNC